VLDGTYIVSAQAFDARGIPGQMRSTSVQLNRSAPAAPTGLAGGRNDRISTQPIVDLQWDKNLERDILGYRVYRVNGAPDFWPACGSGSCRPAGDAADTVVCGSSTSAVADPFCFDPAPPTSSAQYYAVALDRGPGNAAREGAYSALLTADATPNTPPAFPAGTTLSATVTNGQPTLTWSAAAADTDTEPILFYRIYRDAAASPPGYGDRYDRSPAARLNYADAAPGAATAHTYWVTAVDTKFQESQPLGPVTTP
jgi:hypothetical protein